MPILKQVKILSQGDRNMCYHRKIEMLGRIENVNGRKYVNIYNCKKCGSTVIFVENSKPKKIDYKYFK